VKGSGTLQADAIIMGNRGEIHRIRKEDLFGTETYSDFEGFLTCQEVAGAP